MRDRLKLVLNDTSKVALWVFVSAGATALLSWALDKPELAQYYGVFNILLYLIKKGNEEFRK